MLKTEIEQLLALADKKHKGDLDLAIGDFLGESVAFDHAKGVPAGFEAAVNGIRFEVEQYKNADTETRKQIDAYKLAKSPKFESGTNSAKSK